jgi:hypothetical protein
MAIESPNFHPHCFSCTEGNPEGECPNSNLSCGHHCDCSWTQDICHYCGKEFGEEGEVTDSTEHSEDDRFQLDEQDEGWYVIDGLAKKRVNNHPITFRPIAVVFRDYMNELDRDA